MTSRQFYSVVELRWWLTTNDFAFLSRRDGRPQSASSLVARASFLGPRLLSPDADGRLVRLDDYFEYNSTMSCSWTGMSIWARTGREWTRIRSRFGTTCSQAGTGRSP